MVKENVFEDPADARTPDLSYKKTILFALNDVRRNSGWQTRQATESMRRLKNNYRRLLNLESFIAPYTKDGEKYMNIVRPFKQQLKFWAVKPSLSMKEMENFHELGIKWQTCMILRLARVRVLPRTTGVNLWQLVEGENGELINVRELSEKEILELNAE